MRTINLHLDGEAIGHRREVTGTALWNALGYLGQWGMTFPVVDIYTDGAVDLVACFRREDGTTGYTIGAIWRESEGQYSFHS